MDESYMRWAGVRNMTGPPLYLCTRSNENGASHTVSTKVFASSQPYLNQREIDTMVAGPVNLRCQRNCMGMMMPEHLPRGTCL